MDILKSKKLILASKSPRRKELLEKAHIDFEIRTKEVEEIYPDSLPLKKIPAYLAKLKASTILGDLKENEILLTADTIVIHNDIVLGKPKNKEEAFSFLTELANDSHTVVTAVQLCSITKTLTIEDTAEVLLYPMNDKEIDWYLDKYEPYDKAGAYGIQDWIGFAKIKAIEGTYATIMGLPISKVYQSLLEWDG